MEILLWAEAFLPMCQTLVLLFEKRITLVAHQGTFVSCSATGQGRGSVLRVQL